jgi:TonB family protein
MRNLLLLILSSLCLSACAQRAPATVESMPPEFRDGIKVAIKGQLKKFTKCYKDARKRKSSFASGTVNLQWDINTVGGVEKAEAKQSSGDGEFDKCLVTTLAKIKFPAPAKDQYARVVYPFVFNK